MEAAAVLREVGLQPEAGPFLAPVDPVALRIPDYPSVVKIPMDLGTIRRKLQVGSWGGVVGCLLCVTVCVGRGGDA